MQLSRRRDIKLTPPKKRPLTPVHRQQNPRSHAHTHCKIRPTPNVNSDETRFEIQAPHVIKDSRVADVGQTAQMAVLKSFVDRVVHISIDDLISRETGRSLRHLVELLAQILALLMSALRRRGQRSQLVIDLEQQLMQFAEVQGTRFILVVLFEEPIQAAQMVRRLREALLDFGSNGAPFGEGDVHRGWVFALLPGQAAEEMDEVVGDVVLDGGAVADGVDGAEGGAVEAEVGVGFEGVVICLDGNGGRDGFRKVGLSCMRSVKWTVGRRMRETDRRL